MAENLELPLPWASGGVSESVSREVEALSKTFNATEKETLTAIGLLKAEAPGGISVGPTRGFLDSPNNLVYTSRGIREFVGPIPPKTLRFLSGRNPITNIGINNRCRQFRQFAKPQEDKDEPGFYIRMKNRKVHPTEQNIAEMKYISRWFHETGRRDFKGHEDRPDSFADFGIRAIRDYYEIDRVPVEIRRDQIGRPVDFWGLDGASIKNVVSTGYLGDRSDFDPRAYALFNEVQKQINEGKLEKVPHNMEDIRFVQEIDGLLRAAFTHQDLILDSHQKRTEMMYRDQGFSPVEQSISVIVAFMAGLEYNRSAFDTAIPKIGIAFRDSDFNQQQLDDIQQAWMANMRGISGSFKTPFFPRDVSVIDFMKSSRDMDYSNYMQLSGSLVFSIMGIDSAEVGLRFLGGQNVMNENMDARQKFSHDRGLIDILSVLSNLCNKIMRVCGWSDKYEFVFTGIDPQDREYEQALTEKELATWKDLNQVRAAKDLPPLEHGDIPMNPTYIQYLMQKEQAAQVQQQQSGGMDFSQAEPMIDEGLDAALDDLFRARVSDGSDMRTILI